MVNTLCESKTESENIKITPAEVALRIYIKNLVNLLNLYPAPSIKSTKVVNKRP